MWARRRRSLTCLSSPAPRPGPGRISRYRTARTGLARHLPRQRSVNSQCRFSVIGRGSPQATLLTGTRRARPFAIWRIRCSVLIGQVDRSAACRGDHLLVQVGVPGSHHGGGEPAGGLLAAFAGVRDAMLILAAILLCSIALLRVDPPGVLDQRREVVRRFRQPPGAPVLHEFRQAAAG